MLSGYADQRADSRRTCKLQGRANVKGTARRPLALSAAYSERPGGGRGEYRGRAYLSWGERKKRMRRIWNAHGQAAKAQPLVCGLASVWPRRRGATTAGQRRTRVYALSNRPMAARCEALGRLGPEKARHLRLLHSSAMLLHGRQGCAFLAALLQVP